MELSVIILDKQVKKFNKIVSGIADQLAEFFPKKGEIEVYIINSRRMRNLNKRFRGKDKTTNVLSFQKPKNFPPSPLGERPFNTKSFSSHSSKGEGLLGEVYLDPIYIQKQHANSALPDFVLQQCERAHANNRKHCSVAMTFMLVHGVLHILGYDHKKKSDRIKMERKEVELLLKIQMPKSK